MSSSSQPSLLRSSAQSSTLTNSTDALPPRVLARVAREIRDLMKSPPDGIKLIVDRETGLPSNLSEIMVRANDFCFDVSLSTPIDFDTILSLIHNLGRIRGTHRNSIREKILSHKACYII
jgi:hypothetical protein